VRVSRGRYDLSPRITGQIGQKERLNGQPIDSKAKTSNLSNLSDLSDLSERGQHSYPVGARNRNASP
jgi:hypothetical protein